MSVKIKQHDVTDCGAACIASIAAYYKLLLPISRIRQLASTDKKGTSITGLLEALERLGFEAKGVRGEFDSLFKIPKPAIAHVEPKPGLHHYVVIYGACKSFVEIMDPGDGQIHRHTHDNFRKIWTGVLVILLPGSTFRTGDHKHSITSQFWDLIKPHKTIMVQALAGALVYTLIGLTTSIYVQKIVDYVIVDENVRLLNMMSVIMIGLLFLQVFIGAMKSLLTLHTGQLIDAQLILGYYKHLLRLPQQFFDTMRTGEITSRISDAVKIRAFINDAFIGISVNVFIVVFSFGLMFTYYWKLGLIILLILPFYSLAYIITNAVNKKVERKLMERAADLESQLVESLTAIQTIKCFALEKFSGYKTEVRFITLLKSVFHSGRAGILTSSVTDFLSHFFTIALLWAGSGYVLDKEITPGELLSFYALIGYFTGPASSLIGMNKTIQNAVIAAERLFEIMDMDQEKDENKISLTPALIGDISFCNVQFRYGSSVTVFSNLTLHIPKGKVTAIVGESGSGKSTLMSILQNLYPIQGGTVRIGEYDLRNFSHQSLRMLVGIVPQKISLFAGNILDNIAVGEYEPDIHKIMEICTTLGLVEFIDNLPYGFNTYLGENGATLSGGQKQRIAIARALYREPEVLILDEATASLDSSSEQYVQRVTDVMRKNNKTVIVIAHRLSTVFRADKIVVLHAGEVIEEGCHDDLMTQRGHYYKLWRQQFPMVADMI